MSVPERSVEERAAEALFESVMADPHAGLLPAEVWRKSCEWYAMVLATAGLLASDDTERLVRIGSVVEAERVFLRSSRGSRVIREDVRQERLETLDAVVARAAGVTP